MTRRLTTLAASLVAALASPAEALAQSPVPPAPVDVEPAPQAPPEPLPVVKVEQPPPLPPPPTDVPDAPDPLPFKRRPFVGIWGGPGFANVVHPQLATNHVYGPLLALQIGLTLSRQWSVGLEFTNLDRGVERKTEKERFTSSATFLHTQADCTKCSAPTGAGPVLATTLLLDTVGPRVDFTPLGQTGPYLAASGGLSVVTMLDKRVGAGGTAHAGFRFSIADVLFLGLEGGVQGQSFSGGSAFMGFGALSAQLAVIEAKTSKKPGVYVVPQRSGPMVNTPR